MTLCHEMNKKKYLTHLAKKARDDSYELEALLSAKSFPESYKTYAYFIIHELRSGARAVAYGVDKNKSDEKYYKDNKIKCQNYIEHAKVLQELIILSFMN
jgi:hypothetical protein